MWYSDFKFQGTILLLITVFSCSGTVSLPKGGSSEGPEARPKFSEADVYVAVGQTLQFSAKKGEKPYEFSLVSGDGSITSSGLYTAPTSITGNSYSAEVSVESKSGLKAKVSASVIGGVTASFDTDFNTTG